VKRSPLEAPAECPANVDESRHPFASKACQSSLVGRANVSPITYFYLQAVERAREVFRAVAEQPVNNHADPFFKGNR
jgi:hypothetical protein